MNPSPILTISIVNWNTRDDLAKALASLALGGLSSYEVIVVDNGSSDGSAEMVRQRFPEVTLIANQENLGFARAHNQALRLARGRNILLLNPDCMVHKKALIKLVDFIESHFRVAAVGPKLRNPDATIQFSCRHFPNFAAGLFRNTPLGSLFPRNRYSQEYLMKDWDHTIPREVDWISGAAMCIKRQALEDVGLLDEEFFMYCEDVDWCYRARLKGWLIYYFPKAIMTHLIGRSSDQRPREMIREFHRSMALFYRKHYAQKWPFILRWLPVAAIKLRMWFILWHSHLPALNNNGKRRPKVR